jgi:OmpA-OmpF porin, OOP family
MSSPIRWFYGLIPLALLTVAAIASRQADIEADLAARGQAALKPLEWANVALHGRDAVLKGEAPAPEARPAAFAIAAQVYGTRLVRDETTLLPEAKPFATSITREGNRAVVRGNVPPGSAARKALLDAVRNAFPGLSVEDQLKPARGAPAQHLAFLTFGLGELAKLATGQLSLSDQTLSLTGRAETIEADDSIRARLQALPAGLALGKGLGHGDITSPAIRPYLFSAVRGARDLTLTGFVPDQKVREDILDLARRYFEGDRVVDSLQIGLGAPEGFLAALRGGMQDLSRLMPGAALSISDQSVALRGLAPIDQARDAVLAGFRARLPASFGAVAEINTAPPPPIITRPAECNDLFQDLLTRARIQFDTGSAAIAPESHGLLDRLVVAVRRCAGAKVEIAGHTDSVGSAEGNLALSEARAKAVVDYLAKSGIAGERVEARGYGPSRPVATNETAEGRAQNRRIEFTVQ